jgi:hypothetical protein
MNTLRRIMALVMAVGMVMGMSCTAFAESNFHLFKISGFPYCQRL